MLLFEEARRRRLPSLSGMRRMRATVATRPVQAARA